MPLTTSGKIAVALIVFAMVLKFTGAFGSLHSAMSAMEHRVAAITEIKE